MPPLSHSDDRLLWFVGILGSIFFVVVCFGIYFLFKRLARIDDEALKKAGLPPENTPDGKSNFTR